MRRLPAVVAAAALAVLLGTCERPAVRVEAPTESPVVPAAPVPPPIPSLPEPLATVAPVAGPPPLDAPEPLISLPVDGFADAVVSLPLGSRRKRPILLATHGNYDRPDWQCDVWRKIIGSRAFVLCLRGASRPDSPSPEDTRYWYLSNLSLEHEVDAAIRALAARYPEYVDVDRPLYTGFSLGAIMGVSIAVRAPARYPRLVLIEGGHEKWTPKAAAMYARGGGKRVLFVCAQTWTANEAKLAAHKLETAGIATRVVHGPDVGHAYDGPTAEETKRNLAWVLDGDPRWEEEENGPPGQKP